MAAPRQAADALEALEETLARVVQRQLAVTAGNTALLDALISTFEGAKGTMTAGTESVGAALGRLQEAVKETQEGCGRAHREYLSDVGMLSRVVEAHFQEPELYQAKGWTADPVLCDQIIADHLYRVGAFDIGELFQSETDAKVSPTLQKPFRDIFQILEQLKAKELGPALEWCEGYATVPDVSPSQTHRLQCLLFQLHQLQVITMLQRGDRAAAVQYVQTHLGSHHERGPQAARDVRRLLTAALWAGRLEGSPYRWLLAEELWGEAAYLFTTVACAALGLPKDSNLSVCVAAGYLALPTLAKYAQLRPRFRGAQCDVQMPDFGPELQFHSTFACPVIQQVSTPSNPPMLLPCQHVLSQSAVTALVKAAGRLKCPYCPMECQRDQCMVLHLYNTPPPGAPPFAGVAP